MCYDRRESKKRERLCVSLHSIQVLPCQFQGTVSVPPSKSAAHRAIICAALAGGKSVIQPIDLSNDITATINCMKSLGAKIELDGNILTVDGSSIFSENRLVLDCGESGSTLRFLIPIAAAGGIETEFIGHGLLPQRPIGVYTDCLPKHGVRTETKGGLPLKIDGILKSGAYEIPGNISSQFITGLLLALPLLEGDSEIILTSPAQSVGYIQMTIDMMHAFGVEVQKTSNGWHISGSQHYSPRNFTVEGDWSQAAFFMTMAALNGEIMINNLDIHSSQGDKACIEIYQKFGANISLEEDKIKIHSGKLKGIEINAENIPDMVPALAVCAALAEGTTVISHAERLRIKECDRLRAMTENLSKLGADITETPDGLIIKGVPQLHGGSVKGFNDHRIVMSLACAAAACNGEIIISDKESINKSYPSFFEDYQKLGGKSHVIMG